MNKITCNVIKDILPLYIDGVVSEDTQKIVDEHLAECSLCRDEMNKLKKTLVIPTNEEIQQETVNVLEKSISSIERTVVKKFIHYSSYFDLIFNIGIVAICRALINNPDLILADEPTGNLDSKSGKIVIDALNKISSEYKKTIVMVTHDPQMASYCSRLILLKDGVILEDLKNSGDQEAFYQEILGKMKEL